ncbi:MAG TPA: ATP cone domain-containing protein, partial [Candidatus Paceibacterota bacterium]
MAFTQKIKKRNGEIVDFYPDKIILAVKKAFLATLRDEHETDAKEITRTVVDAIDARFGEKNALVPSVEEIQDLVENALMQRGYFTVAKSYIIYRYEHAKERQARREEIVKKIESKELTVRKRDGIIEPFSIEKIKKTLAFVAADQSVVDVNLIAKQCEMELHDGIETRDISRALTMVVRSMIEQDPAYSVVASRLLLHSLYKETIGHERFDYKDFDRQYRAAFVENIKRGIELRRLDPRLLEFDLIAISKLLAPERDDLFRYLGLQTLNDRYFVKESDKGRTLESPQYFWMRVALGLAMGEKAEERLPRVKEFYDVMSTLHYVPSTPTLFNADTPWPQLSSCYLNTVM